jgi:hypothetical protein
LEPRFLEKLKNSAGAGSFVLSLESSILPSGLLLHQGKRKELPSLKSVGKFVMQISKVIAKSRERLKNK